MGVSFSSDLVQAREYQKDQPPSAVSAGDQPSRLEPSRLRSPDQNPPSALRGHNNSAAMTAAPSTPFSFADVSTDSAVIPEPLGLQMPFMAVVDLDDTLGIGLTDSQKYDLD